METTSYCSFYRNSSTFQLSGAQSELCDLNSQEGFTVELWFNEPLFNEPLFNEVLDITNDILGPG